MQARIIFRHKSQKSNGIKELAEVLRELTTSTNQKNPIIDLILREKHLQLVLAPLMWMKHHNLQSSSIIYQFDQESYEVELINQLARSQHSNNSCDQNSDRVIACYRINIKQVLKVISSLKKTLKTAIFYFINQAKSSLECLCDGGFYLVFNLTFETIPEPRLLEFIPSQFALIEEFSQSLVEVFQNWSFSHIILLPESMQFREYAGDVCVNSLILKKDWLKHYNYETLMFKLTDRNTIRLCGEQFFKSIRFGSKMKKASLFMYVDTSVLEDQETQMMLQMQYEGSSYKKNLACELMRLNQSATASRNPNEWTAPMIKRNNGQNTFTRVKQLHMSQDQFNSLNDANYSNSNRIKINQQHNQGDVKHLLERVKEMEREEIIKNEQLNISKGESSSTESEDSDWNRNPSEREPGFDYYY